MHWGVSIATNFTRRQFSRRIAAKQNGSFWLTKRRSKLMATEPPPSTLTQPPDPPHRNSRSLESSWLSFLNYVLIVLCAVGIVFSTIEIIDGASWTKLAVPFLLLVVGISRYERLHYAKTNVTKSALPGLRLREAAASGCPPTSRPPSRSAASPPNRIPQHIAGASAECRQSNVPAV